MQWRTQMLELVRSKVYPNHALTHRMKVCIEPEAILCLTQEMDEPCFSTFTFTVSVCFSSLPR